MCMRKRLPGKFHLREECKNYTWHPHQRLPFDELYEPRVAVLPRGCSVGNKSECKSSSVLERMVFC